MNLSGSYATLFNDKRLERRGEQLLNSLFRSGSSSIQSIAATRAEQKGYYRLLRNKKVTESSLISELVQRCNTNCKGKVVLSIQDSSEINLCNHHNRITHDQSIGSINDSLGVGFKIHPSFVIDAFSSYPYGYSAIDIWSRPRVKETLSTYKRDRLDVMEKESRVWIQSNKATYQNLTEAQSVIIVQDREGDFFEQFAAARQDGKFFLLIRSNHNRLLDNGIKLWDYIDKQPVIGSYTILLSNHPKGKPAKQRQATIQVKAAKVKLKKPRLKATSLPLSSVELTVIEAREVNSNCETPVLWRLYTTWPVNTFEDACQIIEWYSCRWFIEEVFKVLKKECFDIEASELESGWAIRKLTLMMLDSIVKLFQMAIAYDTPEGEVPDTATMFDTEETACMQKINQKIQGKTKQLSNPFNQQRLTWAFWILARLGGWKGYSSQRKPGFATLLKGLKIFYDIYRGYTMQLDVGTQ